MFTKENLQKIFQEKYNADTWQNMLVNLLQARELRNTPELLDTTTDKEQGYYLGKLQTEDALMGFFYYKITKGSVLHRRVGLRNLVKQFINPRWGVFDAALVVFDDGEHWRLSLVCDIKEASTAPKRYTYLFGESEQTYHTAIERFEWLQKEKISLKNLLEAFNVEKLSKAFFADYKQLYQQFCNHLISKPSYRVSFFGGGENADKAIRDFTKKFLGRIVFLYFLQKKGWLGAKDLRYKDGDKNFIFNLFQKSGSSGIFYSKWLQQLFFETLNKPRENDDFVMPDGETVKIPFLNGGLFEKEDNEKDELKCPDFPKELFEKLFQLFNQYNFTIYEDDPNDHTVAVDPEMLGHIFENLLEDNKDKGAYYTPKEIVHYMCQESLKEYCLNHDLHDLTDYCDYKLFVENLINKKNINHQENSELCANFVNLVVKKLDAVKICDPAIGSGAFPMGLLQEIFSAKQMLYLFEHDSLEGFSASEVKLNIIQNSIYGVDIEKGAVDIARLRFWLSLIIDEELPKPLPNLDYKIVVGNSLISKFEEEVIDIDWSLDATSQGFFGAELAQKRIELLDAISEKQKTFFSPKSDKKKLIPEIRNLKIDLLINQLELMIKTKGIETAPTGTGKAIVKQNEVFLQTQGWKQLIHKLQTLRTQPEKPLQFFDWKLDFPEVMNPILAQFTDGINAPPEGFDIVIGNPPYRQLKWLATDYSTFGFETFSKNSDIYCLFFEKSANLLKERGIGAFITSNKWLRTDYGKLLKAFFKKNRSTINIIDFNGYQVFETATVDTAITFWKILRNNLEVSIQQCDRASMLNELTFEKKKNLKIDDVWNYRNDSIDNVRIKIEKNCKRLIDCEVELNYGILTGANPVFILDKEKYNLFISKNPNISKYIVPILRGKDLDRFGYVFNNFYLLNLHNGIKEKGIQPITLNPIEDVDLLEYLDSFGVNFKNRGEQGVNWYNLRSCNYIDKYKLPKILYADISNDTGKFIFDENGFYTNDTAFMIYHTDKKYLKYLVAVLNSKAANFLYLNFYCGGILGKSGIRFKKEFLSLLPIPNISVDQQLPLITLVNQILSAKKENPAADTSELEREIDKLVYELYGLTEEEIGVIEGKN